MDPRTLATFLADSLDGGTGPDDEGFIGAGADGEAFLLTYTDDESGVKSKFRIAVEVIE